MTNRIENKAISLYHDNATEAGLEKGRERESFHNAEINHFSFSFIISHGERKKAEKKAKTINEKKLNKQTTASSFVGHENVASITTM